MKRLYMVLYSIVFGLNFGFAQDIIVKKDGSTIKAKVTKVGDKEVDYKKYGNKSNRLYSISLSNILSINYEDGEIEKFDNSNQTNTVSKSSNKTDCSSPQENANAISKFNSNELKLKSTVKPGGSTHSIGCLFGVEDNSTLVNKDVEILMHVSYNYKDEQDCVINGYYFGVCLPYFVFSIKNRTSKTVYLDLGNTFLVINGTPQTYYVPSSTSTTNGTNTGASVNVGAITGALGIGGPIGTLANGVNVGGGKTNSTTSVTYSQRVIAIPPMSTKELEHKPLPDGNVIKWEYDRNKIALYEAKKLKVGASIDLSQENSPYKAIFILTYSKSETLNQEQSISSNYYIKKIMGVPKGSIMMASTVQGSAPVNIDKLELPDQNIFFFTGNKE